MKNKVNLPALGGASRHPTDARLFGSRLKKQSQFTGLRPEIQNTKL